ncbi:TraV family lipoprotein [Bdellovibrionota bacterium FG-1]
MNRADSLRMLDRRSEYEAPGRGDTSPHLKEAGLAGFHNAPIPVRTRAQVAPVWIFPHETASRDYFWGGWISIVTEQPQWVLTQPGRLPPAPGVVDAALEGSTK